MGTTTHAYFVSAVFCNTSREVKLIWVHYFLWERQLQWLSSLIRIVLVRTIPLNRSGSQCGDSANS